jgi:hypothetical protein
MEPLHPSVWLERCASRIVEVDSDIGADEARRIARAMQAFERTRAMAPEGAVDFVATELRAAQARSASNARGVAQ